MVDSGFGYVQSIFQIKNSILVAMTAIKNKAHSPNHMEAQEAVNNIQGQYVVTIKA